MLRLEYHRSGPSFLSGRPVSPAAHRPCLSKPYAQKKLQFDRKPIPSRPGVPMGSNWDLPTSHRFNWPIDQRSEEVGCRVSCFRSQVLSKSSQCLNHEVCTWWTLLQHAATASWKALSMLSRPRAQKGGRFQIFQYVRMCYGQICCTWDGRSTFSC